MTNNSEQIRQLENKVHLAGKLAQLSKKIEGVTKEGNIPYISFNGVIRCGETEAYDVRFKTFVKSKKADGTDSKAFINVKKWYDTAVSIADDPENATMVDAIGSVTDNPYVNAEGKLVEAVQYNLNLLGEFNKYAAEIDLEGFIHTITDETKGEEATPTGRKRMRLISRDIFRNTLDIKNIVMPEDMANAAEDAGWEKNATAIVRLELQPHAAAPKKSTGFGKQHTTSGKEYLELVVVGGEQAYDSESEKALSPKVVKIAMTERQNHLDEIENAGYKGTKTAAPTGGFGKKAAPAKKAADVDFLADDEIPF